jgi:hypothetical protein
MEEVTEIQGPLLNVAVSGDGRWFVLDDEARLQLLSTDGDEHYELVPDEKYETLPRWLPDGSILYYRFGDHKGWWRLRPELRDGDAAGPLPEADYGAWLESLPGAEVPAPTVQGPRQSVSIDLGTVSVDELVAVAEGRLREGWLAIIPGAGQYRLLPPVEGRVPHSLTPNGRYDLVETSDGLAVLDVGDGTLTPIGPGWTGQVSPDGRWAAVIPEVEGATLGRGRRGVGPAV